MEFENIHINKLRIENTCLSTATLSWKFKNVSISNLLKFDVKIHYQIGWHQL